MKQYKNIMIGLIAFVFLSQIFYANEIAEDNKKGFVANYGRTYITNDGINFEKVPNKYDPIYCKGVSKTEFVSYNNGLTWHKKNTISKRSIPFIDNRLELLPNPIRSSSTLIAHFQDIMTVEIKLIDLKGRQIKTWTMQTKEGKNEFFLNFENIPGYENIVARIAK